MGALYAARTQARLGAEVSVTVLEKMPRPARKIMISGKGRCNLSNIKEWNDFCTHIHGKAQFCKNAFFNLTPQGVLDLFGSIGLPTVVERGDRAFPASYRASDVVDCLVNACLGAGVKIECEFEVTEVLRLPDGGFRINSKDGRSYLCRALVIATGGLSYPGTGSSGDGYRWAAEAGHRIVSTFPSLTALVPAGYKNGKADSLRHIDRSTPLSELGRALCGVQLKNVGASLSIDGNTVQEEFGDIDFTDGGIEGPIGFQLSRRAVKALVNGSKVRLTIDLKYGVKAEELSSRIRELGASIQADSRSRGLGEKARKNILLGKLLPRELIAGFVMANSGRSLSQALKEWNFDIEGYVGYERAVVTAGGVSTDELLPKTMESRLVKGLYFCGEVLDHDCDTGGYNLQIAFSTGALAGQSAARGLIEAGRH